MNARIHLHLVNFRVGLRACLQEERVTLASGLPYRLDFCRSLVSGLFFTRQPGLPG